MGREEIEILEQFSYFFLGLFSPRSASDYGFAGDGPSYQ